MVGRLPLVLMLRRRALHAVKALAAATLAIDACKNCLRLTLHFLLIVSSISMYRIVRSNQLFYRIKLQAIEL